MRYMLYFFVYVCAVMGGVLSAQAETLTLSIAVERALQQSTSLDIQHRVIQEAEGIKTDVSALPNPTLSYVREELSQAGGGGGEWGLSASMPIAFLWTRGPETRIADARIQAETLTLSYLQDQTRFDVQRAFVEYHFAQQKYQAWKEVSVLIETAWKTGNLRYAEGDISKYEQQRIALEALRYRRLEAESFVELSRYRRKLAFYLNQPSLDDVETILESPKSNMDIHLDTAIRGAMAHRFDLKALGAFVNAGQEAVNAEGRKRLSEANLSFGYKRQEDGFKGAVLEAEIGLPIFNRNQGKIKTAQSVLERQRLTFSLLEKQIQIEVSSAFDQYRLYAEQVKQFEQAHVSPNAMLDIARFAYAEGDMSLVEMLDGLQAYTEAFLSRLDLLKAFHTSKFELEKAIGQPLSELN